jgi:hypothetical protein
VRTQLNVNGVAECEGQTAQITDKKGYGARWGFKARKVDNLLASGLPHLKIGARRVRILIPEADAWMREKFFVQRQPTEGK